MKELILSTGQTALLDDDDFERVLAIGKWFGHALPNGQFYIQHNCSKCRLVLPRFLLGLARGEAARYLDGNGLNNQKANLQVYRRGGVEAGSVDTHFCNKCEKELSVDNFPVRVQYKGKATYLRVCKGCKNTHAREYEAARTKADPGRHRVKMLKYNFGLTPEEWNQLFESQDKRCAICLRDKPVGQGWATDHDHDTEKVRGILCVHCNTLLGHAEEKITTLQRAIQYLLKHKGDSYEQCVSRDPGQLDLDDQNGESSSSVEHGVAYVQ